MPVSGTHPDAFLASEGVVAMGVQLKLSARFASGAVTLLVTLGEHDWKTEATLMCVCGWVSGDGAALIRVEMVLPRFGWRWCCRFPGWR